MSFTRQLAQVIPTVVGALVLVFLMLRVLPGDPATAMLGTNATPQAVEDLRAQLGLDRPLLLQFVDYVVGLAHLDLGRSLALRAPVSTLIGQALIPTLLLTLGGSLVSLVVGVPLGVVAALKRATWIDYLASVGALLGISVPVFVWGLLLLLAFTLQWPLLPSSGAGSTPLEALRALVLPSIATGFFQVGLVARITRSSLLSVLAQDYIRTARAKGLSERTVVYRHALRNAMIPVATVLGPALATLIVGSFFIEYMFSFPGMGRLFVQSINARDYSMIMGTTLIYATLIAFANLVVDLVYGWLDPRISYS